MSDDHFSDFITHRRSDLRRISRATLGESTPEDVEAEAWLMVAELRGKGVAIDLSQPAHQQLVIARLYQHLVRYTERNVRFAVRLDHSPSGEDGEAHPLARMLAADESSNPLVKLAQEQERSEAEGHAHVSPWHSLAGAYVHLLQRFDNSMAALADHLLISISYCYRRCAHARTLAVHQWPLPPRAMQVGTEFVPRAWRQFKLQRPQVQLTLPFEGEAALFADNP